MQAASLLFVLAGRLPALRKKQTGTLNFSRTRFRSSLVLTELPGHIDRIKGLHEWFAGWPWLPAVLRSNRRLKGWLVGLPANPIDHFQCIPPLKHASNDSSLTRKINQRQT